ncbi:MAG: L,D-transpeptidase family protein [Pseudomonadota bacterium]
MSHSLRFFPFVALLALPALADMGEAEHLFNSSVQEIRQNRLDSALQTIDSLIERYPNFRLAQLVKGDLLLARAQPISTLGNAPGARDQQADLREEAKVRVQAISAPVSSDLVPEELLQAAPDTEYIIAVDSSRSRLYVFRNDSNVIRRVADYYVTVGKFGIGKNKEGDKRTPVGLYTITSFKPDSELEELYGIGAYPLSYPNEWDVRNGRNGYGIWLHGVPRDTYSRPPKASDGCVVLSNDDLKTLGRYIRIGKTPVIIAPKLTWVDAGSLASAREELLKAVYDWRNDWESLDTERLLAHYSPDFLAGSQRLPEFAETKRRVNAAKTWIKVEIKRLSIYRQPGDKDMAVITFDQDYKSSNLSDLTRKRQYWQRKNGRWRIIQETVL